MSAPELTPKPLTRREAIKRIMAASALAVALDLPAFAATEGARIGFDPDLTKKEIPWPRVLTAGEKRIVTALGDIIIPADDHGPAASAVGVPDFIDEWVSAPYETQQRDLGVIRKGLSWIDAEANRRFQKGFAECSAEQAVAMVDDILREDSEARKQGYNFFRLFRDRVAGGYYSTPEGWRALGYTGNVPVAGDFPGPSEEVLKQIGVL